MAGQFYLGEFGKFSFGYPYFQTMDLVTGYISTNGPEIILADISAAILAPNGAATVFALNALPTGVAVEYDIATGANLSLKIAPVTFPLSPGRWVCTIANPSGGAASCVPQTDYFDVLDYYNPAKLTQIFEANTGPGGASIMAHYGDPEQPPLQYQIVKNASGGNAATYAEIAQVGPITLVD